MLMAELSQYKYLKIEIQQQRRRLELLKAEEANYKKMLGQGTHEDYLKLEKISVEVTNARNLLLLSIDKCLKEKEVIEEYIQSIDNTLIRIIMRSRYLDDMKWQKIAFEIDKYDESYPRRKHNQYLMKEKK